MKIKNGDNEKSIYKYYIENGDVIILFQDITLDELKSYFEDTSNSKIFSDDILIRYLDEYKLAGIQYSDVVTVTLSRIDVERAEMEKKIETLEESNELLINCLLEMSAIVYQDEIETEEDSSEQEESSEEAVEEETEGVE